MKIAVVYNRESRSVINLFGMPNREKIGMMTIKGIADALKQHGHQVKTIEGDKDLIDNLEDFMPRVLSGERPGMVFNLSYGIQGQARYTHVPGILEMVGIPYVGSGPLAHSLALDKVVSKMMFRQNDLPTPDFVVLGDPGQELPDLPYPMIVKPKNEAVSFGLEIVNNEEELRKAAKVILDEFTQPVLAEQYIEGREVNVGLLGNNPPEVLPPVEITFGSGGPTIYTYEDKTGKSGREIGLVCPAPIGEDLTAQVQELALRAFSVLGCYDCARVDMRLDSQGNLYILEINSLPSMGPYGSYPYAAKHAGLEYPALVNRLVESASARYFGTPHPPLLKAQSADVKSTIFSYLTERRDQIEKRLATWVGRSGRTADPVGLRGTLRELGDLLAEVGLKEVPDLTDERSVKTWETAKGLKDGTLLIGHLDVPLPLEAPRPGFHRDPEWLHGEGIGVSRAPLVMLEFALRALRSQRRLRHLPLGVLYYQDEGRDCRYSAEIIREAARQARQVLILRPGRFGDHVVTQRRGRRVYQLVVEGESLRPGQPKKKPDVLRWTCARLEEIAALSSTKERVAVAAADIHTDSHPMRLPHRATVTLFLSYLDTTRADELERELRELLGKNAFGWELELIADRPAMKETRANRRVWKALSAVAQEWEIPLRKESSFSPSVAGLVPPSVGTVCAVGPVAQNLYTPQESVQRITLVQRTLLLAQFLAQDLKPVSRRRGETKKSRSR